jgi:N-acetylmuramoyl-L-alanine amidase
MFKSILTLLFCISLLGAASNKEILGKADTLSKSSKTANLFKAYNDYKTLYLNAVTSSDQPLREKALQGIVKSGTKLNIDISEYADELKNFDKKTTKSSKKVALTSITTMKSIRWDEDTLVLSFDQDLDPKQIKYFTIHDIKHNRFRYVFDISSSSLTKNQALTKQGISRIKLNQFDTKTLRLVFEDQDKINLSFDVDGNDLKITVIAANGKPVGELFKDTSAKVEEPKEKEESSEDIKKYSKSSKQKIIVIDPGHGGKDSGAIGYKNYYEKNVVLDVAQNVRNMLVSRGYKVYMTRDNDTFIELKERTAMANRKDADLFISIHANAVSSASADRAYGIETYFLSPSRSSRATRVAAMENSTDISDMSSYGKSTFLNFTTNLTRIASNKLAIDVQKGILGNLRKYHKDVVDAGVREGPFWVLVGAQMPAILVEIGFITNPQESQMLVDKTYEQNMAYGIANGVDRYFINN